MRLVWRFSFRTLEWSAVRCQGQFAPSGRLFHTAVMWGDSLIIAGGVTLDPEDTLGVYRLDMISMRWSRIVPQFPEDDMPLAPLARSHHASTVMGDILCVHGGKPVQAGLTTTDFRRLHQQGFFDVLIMHLPSGSWTRRAHSLQEEYVPAPPLWGHSMIGLESSALLLFGGFEIDLALGTGAATYTSRSDFDDCLDGDTSMDAPSAELQNVMNVFSLKSMRWSAFAPNVMTVGPKPRALHTVQMLRDREMIVLGGVSVVENSGVIVPVSDAWVWNADSGAWKKIDPFPIPPFASSEPHRFQGARVLSALYNDQLVVSNDVTTWYVLDTTDPVEFTVCGTAETDYFYCACVGIDDWQVVTNAPPDAFDNPLAQGSLQELSSLMHPRKATLYSQPRISIAPNRSHTPQTTSVAPNYDPIRGDVLRKFLPFSTGMVSQHAREGTINPIIAALIEGRQSL